jgi:hypothetical protein
MQITKARELSNRLQITTVLDILLFAIEKDE